jgi:iron complex transport system substrate-binding protein
MYRKILAPLLIIALASGFLLGACASAAATPSIPKPTTQATDQPIVLTDGLNHTVTLDQPAHRVVSMAPSNTEILFAIGAGSQVVGRDEFSDYPAEAAKLPSIGGSMGKYNNEAIVDLKPDLVLASELNTAEQVQALEALGLKVYLLSNPTDLDGMYKNLEIVGELTGHQAEAAKLVQSLKSRVAAVEEKLKNVGDQPLVFYELDSTDPNAPYTAGSGTFIDTLLSMAKGRNLGDMLDGQYAQISLEELVVQNPDIILLGDYTWGGVTPADVAKRAGWEKLSAVQNGKVFTFDDNLVSRPGPRLVDGLEALANQLHP